MNETCPFYTVSNAFLSAIVCRHSLNSIYQKLIIVRTERTKRVTVREREWERKCERVRERMGERALVARTRAIRKGVGQD